jgi:hypothetical protein
MTAYRDALAVSLRDAPQRLDLAQALLARGDTVVLLEGQLALRPDGSRVLCEVIDALSEGSRSARRFEALIEGGRSLLRESALDDALRSKQLEWIVVADYGSGTVQLWPQNEERAP